MYSGDNINISELFNRCTTSAVGRFQPLIERAQRSSAFGRRATFSDLSIQFLTFYSRYCDRCGHLIVTGKYTV